MAREYKDSGIKWIGMIPKEWKVCITSSLFHEHKEKNIGLKNTNLLSLSYGKIKRKDINTNEGLLPQSFETYNVIKEGDIVFRLTDLQNDKRSLRTGLCEEDGIITSAYLTLRANNALYCTYFHYLFHSYDECKVFYGLGDGVRQGMNWVDVKNLVIFEPPFYEQQKIADYLDKVCGEVDEMIALQEKMIEELKAYKQSIITEAVTKGLNPNAPMKNSGIDWIGEIPEHWKVIRIKYLLKERKERSVNGVEEPLSMSQKYGLIPTKDMEMIPNMASSFVGAKLVYKNDLVFNKLKAHLGVFAVSDYEGLVSPDYAVYSSTSIVNEKYLEYLFKTPQYIGEFIKLSSGVGAGLTRLYTSDLYSINGIVPPIEEQNAIVSFINTKCSEIDSLIAIKQQKATELKEYKKSVIYEYVTGKKEVV